MTGTGDAAARPRTRHAPVVVEHPRFTVVESAAATDTVALHDALEILVKWAVRAHARCGAPAEDAGEHVESAAVGAGEQA